MAATAAFAAVSTPSAAVCGGARFSVVAPRASLLLLLPTPPTRRSSAASPVFSLQLADATRFSSLRVRASSSEEASSSDEFLADLKAKWDALDDKSTVLLYGGGAIVALWLSSIVVGAINSVPLLPKLMELVGLGYTGWFVYRYLLFKQSRKELANDIEDLKKKIAGSSE